MMYYLLLFVLMILQSSCKTDYYIKFDNVELKDWTLLEDSSIISQPLEMINNKDLLFISTYSGDSLLWVYNIETENMEKRCLKKGLGPNEYLSPIQLLLMDSSLFNIHNRWHYSFDVCKFDAEKLSFESLQNRVSISTDIDMIYPINKNRYIASGRFKEGRFAILDSIGVIHSFFGDYPNYQSEECDLDNFTKFMFHQCMFSYNRSAKKILAVSSHTLQIIDDNDTYSNSIELQIAPYNYDKIIQGGWTRIVKSDETELGAVRVCTNDQYIYILYNPNTDDNSSDFKNEIWVFDWNAKPIKKLLISNQITSLCVDNKNKFIYCVINAPESVIGRIEI